MRWIARWNERRHLRRYARLLYPRLRKLYGARTHFTEEQIRRAAAEASLSPAFIAFGLAMFLPESEYARLHPAAPARDYEVRRAAVVAVAFDAAVSVEPASWDFTDPSDLGGSADGGSGADGGDGD